MHGGSGVCWWKAEAYISQTTDRMCMMDAAGLRTEQARHRLAPACRVSIRSRHDGKLSSLWQQWLGSLNRFVHLPLRISRLFSRLP